MLTEQIKDDLRKVTWIWKKSAIPFTGLLGRTMETRLHYQTRLKESSEWLHASSLAEDGSVARRRSNFEISVHFWFASVQSSNRIGVRYPLRAARKARAALGRGSEFTTAIFSSM